MQQVSENGVVQIAELTTSEYRPSCPSTCTCSHLHCLCSPSKAERIRPSIRKHGVHISGNHDHGTHVALNMIARRLTQYQVTRPTVSLLVIVPVSVLNLDFSLYCTDDHRVASAVASLERIESFLLGSSRVDLRQGTERTDRSRERITDSSQQVAISAQDVLIDLRAAISIHAPTISPSTDADPVLFDINLRIEPSTILLVAGPVGSGKSTLLKAILGEVPFTGNISVSSERIAYCAPTPWLLNDTVRNNVLGFGSGEIDMVFYQTVLNTCALDEDIALLSDGDQTVIGSRGFNFSGGQKQRLVSMIHSHCRT